MTKAKKSKAKAVASGKPAARAGQAKPGSAKAAVAAKPPAGKVAGRPAPKSMPVKPAPVKPAVAAPTSLKASGKPAPARGQAARPPVSLNVTSSPAPGKSSPPMSNRKPAPGASVPASRPGVPARPGAPRSARDLREAREARDEKAGPPRLKKSPYNKRELNPMRNALLALRSRLQGAIDKLGNEALRADEPDTDSEDVADHGSDAFERNMTLGLMENEARTLQQIEEALEQMQTGRYGVCILCGQAVPLARLEALPFATTCVPCQEKAERRL